MADLPGITSNESRILASRIPGEWTLFDDHFGRFLCGILYQHDLARIFNLDSISSAFTFDKRGFDDPGRFCELALVDDDRVSRTQVLETYFGFCQEFLDFNKHLAPGAVVFYNYNLSATLAKLS